MSVSAWASERVSGLLRKSVLVFVCVGVRLQYYDFNIVYVVDVFVGNVEFCFVCLFPGR